MGKIVRFDTFGAIKDAAARAQARERSPLARLDQRAADMAEAYEARQRTERRPARRFVAPVSQRGYSRSGWNPSGITIFNIGMAAFAAFWFLPDYLDYNAQPAPLSSLAATSLDTERASFSLCHTGGGTNCVVDGDTIWYQGANIRIADIDTPETHPARCADEARLGAAATQRLQDLLNAGAFSVKSYERDTDRYGRQLRIVTRGGESIGGMLVDDGLARWYEGGRKSWC